MKSIGVFQLPKPTKEPTEDDCELRECVEESPHKGVSYAEFENTKDVERLWHIGFGSFEGKGLQLD